jgi:menaquinone-dependent protoporphyrinogen oxidase
MEQERILVAYASRMGTTAEIASDIARTLREEGFEVDLLPVGGVRDLTPYRAVVLGSAVYATRWRKDAVRFLTRFRGPLTGRPVWIFQSGPLDDSADRKEYPLPGKVRRLADRIVVRGTVTFGGAIVPERADGFITRSMADKQPGDWRNPERILAWAREVAERLHGMPVA